MKNRFVIIACLFLFVSAIQSSAIAQKLEPYGLQGKTVTALAYYAGALYAGTEGEGLFVRKSPDSSWSELGLKGVRIRSVYPYDIGPIGWGITVGAEPDKSAGDSVLIYCWSIYDPHWAVSDSNLDRSKIAVIRALDGFPDPRICGETFAGGSSGVYRRQLGSNAWEQVLDVGSGIAWDVTVDQVNRVVWACGVSESSNPWIAKSTDKGDSWETTFLRLHNQDSVCYQIAIHPFNPAIIYLAISESVMKTIDGGKTWHDTGLRNTMARLYGLAIDPFDPDHLWAAGEINENYLAEWVTPFVLFESFDAGATWRFVPLILPQVPNQTITAIVADPDQQNMLYIATRGDGVWRYESQPPSFATYFPMQLGNWWTFSKSLTETIIDTMRFNDSLFFQFDQFRHVPNAPLRMTSDNKLLVRANDSEQMWLDFSANIGDSWPVKTPLAEWTVHLESKTDTITVPAGTFTNCYRFWFQFNGADNDWAEWYAPGVGPVKRILYGFGVIDYPLTSAFVNGSYLPTKIEKEPASSNPEQFYLYPNYPNPFNFSTTIRYDLPKSCFVTLKIYNFLGQKVRTLVAEDRAPGKYQFDWDGRDDSGNLLPSGIYLCQLKVDHQISFQKIVFIK